MLMSSGEFHRPKISHDAPVLKSRAVKDAVEHLIAIANDMENLVVPDALERTLELQRSISRIGTRISVVGQVKAGKTALTNALVGRPGLLPSDVNPWTTVITSLHVNAPQPAKKGAVFQFFDKEEWERMTQMGGRLGEFAGRTNYDREAEEMREQVRALQSRALKRLGVNFTFLLGNQHSFSQFDSALIKRYVCLGDEQDDTTDGSGHFADLTKSANLYFDVPSYPMPIVLADTPGVNDPFLVREAVTLDNLANSDICVVVLSAHQALSTVDIGLINIIMALHHKQIVLFVNRIDELEDPDSQTVEIRNHIRRTLKERNISDEIPIIFGSAKSGAVTKSAPSFDAPVSPQMSGIQQLRDVLDEKSSDDVTWPAVENFRDECLDLVNRSALVLEEVLNERSPSGNGPDLKAVSDRISEIHTRLNADFDRLAQSLIEMSSFAMSDAYRSFMVKESRALRDATTHGKGIKTWTPETDGLRRELIDGYNSFANNFTARLGTIMQEAADDIAALYVEILGRNEGVFPVVGPNFGRPKTPVFLMKTMAIDLSVGWLGRLTSQQRKTAGYVEQFEKLATDEMLSTIAELKGTYLQDFVGHARLKLQEFMQTHRTTLRNISVQDETAGVVEMRPTYGLKNEVRQRRDALQSLQGALQGISRNPANITVADT